MQKNRTCIAVIYLSIFFKEHLLSLKCLDSNQEERQACEVYFINYKNCKEFWVSSILIII